MERVLKVYVIQTDSICWDIRKEVARDFDIPNKPEVWLSLEGALASARADAKATCDEMNEDLDPSEEGYEGMKMTFTETEEDGVHTIQIEEDTRWTIYEVPLNG